MSDFGTSLNTTGFAASTSNIGPSTPSFQTFCLETDEFTGDNPTNFLVSDEAVLGGSGGPSPDPISNGTAWLYARFATGSLAGYVYTAGVGRAASATGAPAGDLVPRAGDRRRRQRLLQRRGGGVRWQRSRWPRRMRRRASWACTS